MCPVKDCELFKFKEGKPRGVQNVQRGQIEAMFEGRGDGGG